MGAPSPAANLALLDKAINASPLLRNATDLNGKPLGSADRQAGGTAWAGGAAPAANTQGTSTNYGRSKQAQAASAIDSAGQASRAGKRRTENTLLTGADGAMPANSQLGRTTLLGS